MIKALFKKQRSLICKNFDTTFRTAQQTGELCHGRTNLSQALFAQVIVDHFEVCVKIQFGLDRRTGSNGAHHKVRIFEAEPGGQTGELCHGRTNLSQAPFAQVIVDYFEVRIKIQFSLNRRTGSNGAHHKLRIPKAEPGGQVTRLLRGAEEHLSVVGDPLGRQSRTARHNAQTLAKTGGRPASGLLAHHLVETVAAAGLAPFQVQVQRPQPGHQLANVQPAKLAVVGVLQRTSRQAHRQIERPHRAQLLLRSLAACGGASSGEPQQAAAGEEGGQLLLPVGGHLEAEVEAEVQ
ncbi:hypothetical protein TYRP_017319 [Tyrophagus putrescentiae]|nr:hypothetical protein TYRP_017319 [Tyrophagus putrescentiae]